MAIGTLTATAAAHLYGVNTKAVKREDVKKSAFSPREEKVDIKSKEQSNDRLLNAVKEAPEVRIEMVAELQAKIKSNDYPIEGKLDEMVRKMIQSDIFNAVA